MVFGLAFCPGCCGLLRRNCSGELGVVEMRVYTVKGLEEVLGIGRTMAYEIMREHGFKIGYGKTSSLRITEEAVKKWIEGKEKENENESV